MSFDFSNEMPQDVQKFIGADVDIVNNDFNYFKFAQAFSQAPTFTTPKRVGKPPMQPLSNNIYDNMYPNQGIRSCPSVHRPVFTFDEPSLSSKKSFNEYDAPRAMNGANMSEPILKLQITGNPNYDLDESDILNIISSYGAIVNIELTGPRTAFIVFDDAANAMNAQKSLNGQQVKHLNIKLYLSWADNNKDAAFKPQREARRPSKVAHSLNEIPEEFFPSSSYRGAVQSLCNFDAPQNMFCYSSNKLTCKYDIQIEGDQDFKIARKIIGPKGCNMKKILDVCQQQCRREHIPFQGDSLKLRLRGKGSGFKEGPEQRESDDVLHLCVSSKHIKIHEVACKLVEDLLTGLYKEYGVFCQKMGRPLQAPVQLKRVELSAGKLEDGRVGARKGRKGSIEFDFCQSVSKSMQTLENSTSDSENSDKN